MRNNPNTYIYYLHRYIPVNSRDHNKTSRDILAFKDNKDYAVHKFNYQFYLMLEKLASNNSVSYSERAICVVPKHEANRWSEGLKSTCRYLNYKLGIKDYHKYLYRKHDTEQRSAGGSRGSSVIWNSIDVSYPSKIRNKHIILIDDVTTTGTSLDTCRDILLDNGAASVRCLAIGWTKSDNYVPTYEERSKFRFVKIY